MMLNGQWLSSPLTSGITSLAGLVISVIGFIATLVGLGVTYRQSSQAKGAAEAAEAAASQVRARLEIFDAAAEAVRAMASIRETQRHIRNDAWLSVVDSYATARESLVRLQSLAVTLGDDEKAEIGYMLVDISSVCRTIDKAARDEEPKVNRSKALDKCRDYEEFLQRVSIQLQRAST